MCRTVSCLYGFRAKMKWGEETNAPHNLEAKQRDVLWRKLVYGTWFHLFQLLIQVCLSFPTCSPIKDST